MGSKKVICNICGQAVDIRKKSAMGTFPVQHKKVGHIDNCHGFYVQSNTYPEKEDI